MMNIRNEMMQTLIDAASSIEAQHHEVATAGQSEIDMKFDNLVAMADKVMMYKYILKNVAKKYNKTVTFMPKPLFGDNGSGMHTHASIWKGERAAVCRQRLRRPERDGLVRRRRPDRSTPRRSWASAAPRPTATSAWSPASRPR